MRGMVLGMGLAVVAGSAPAMAQSSIHCGAVTRLDSVSVQGLRPQDLVDFNYSVVIRNTGSRPIAMTLTFGGFGPGVRLLTTRTDNFAVPAGGPTASPSAPARRPSWATSITTRTRSRAPAPMCGPWNCRVTG